MEYDLKITRDNFYAQKQPKANVGETSDDRMNFGNKVIKHYDVAIALCPHVALCGDSVHPHSGLWQPKLQRRNRLITGEDRDL